MTDDLFVKADNEYDKGNLEEAFTLFMQLAHNGDDSAMDRVASMYADAEGVDYDFDKAIYWYKKSVEHGGITSLRNLGVTYRTTGDIVGAKNWFEKSLNAGNHDSALDLAKLYMICEDKKNIVIQYLKICIEGSNVYEDTLLEAKELLERYKQ